MSNVVQNITVFEHEAIRFDKGEKRITEDQFKALQQYCGAGVPYYNLICNGVQFNENVGVIQIGKTTIEVLPKADKNPHSETEDQKWRDILIGMLKAVGSFDIKSTSNSNLKIKPNTILDLYFLLFVKEVEYLIHQGLVKKYRKKQGNVAAMKGALQFEKQIQQNLVHQERFYVNYTTYDVHHILHFILFKTLCLLKQINDNPDLQSRIGALLLDFPEMPDIKVTEGTFNIIVYNRKTSGYKAAVEIARLLLLHYHPDLSKGRNHVLALMFDMNKLWEQFIYTSLHRNRQDGSNVTPQTSKDFWNPESGKKSRIRPDILISKNGNDFVVLDTKWKNLGEGNPSPEDLRQMYVYHEYYTARRVGLVYPGAEKKPTKGKYFDPNPKNEPTKECSLISVSVEPDIKTWQKNICDKIYDWMKSS
ncbi:MAG: restriction endonuclease [Bacteroidetes bacterium]|nr:restriction endonuclease [Bacteroidota bacterium]